MQRHKRIKWKKILAGLVMLLGLAVLVNTTVQALFYAPEKQISLAQSADPAFLNKIDTVEAPARLVIPSLGINASVQYVGINEKGNMAAPSNFSDVGWYKYGPLPGQAGSAVIDGHVDNGLGLPGVFKNLAELKAGDEVDILTKAGRVVHFIVREKNIYPYDQVPTEAIFAPGATAKLNLITCEGTFLPHGRTYDHRLVILADLHETVK